MQPGRLQEPSSTVYAASKLSAAESVQPGMAYVQTLPGSVFAALSKLVARTCVQPKTRPTHEPSSCDAPAM